MLTQSALVPILNSDESEHVTTPCLDAERMITPRTPPRSRKPHLHLAIVYGDYLEKILTGKKTIEGRFTRVRCAPHGRVATGDIVLLKAPAGPVVAQATVRRALFFSDLSPSTVDYIHRNFGAALCLGEDFSSRLQTAKYATLVFLSKVRSIAPRRIAKRDRRGWVVLDQPHQTDLFRAIPAGDTAERQPAD